MTREFLGVGWRFPVGVDGGGVALPGHVAIAQVLQRIAQVVVTGCMAGCVDDGLFVAVHGALQLAEIA